MLCTTGDSNCIGSQVQKYCSHHDITHVQMFYSPSAYGTEKVSTQLQLTRRLLCQTIPVRGVIDRDASDRSQREIVALPFLEWVTCSPSPDMHKAVGTEV
mmetsp:Transcript_8672/g.20812  ORF Transcript_8672/g.20812 Transcript_8672/m.20812 type:complete len:100 (+) Transcript_8672:119-418(+)